LSTEPAPEDTLTPEEKQAHRIVEAAIDLFTSGDPGNYIEYLDADKQDAEVAWYDANEAEIAHVADYMFGHLVHQVMSGNHWMWSDE
jgi:hypothetical protein